MVGELQSVQDLERELCNSALVLPTRVSVLVEQGFVFPCPGSVTPSIAKRPFCQNQFNPPYRFLLSGGFENLRINLCFVNFGNSFPLNITPHSALGH
jgi:hypothetical protein